MLIHSSRHIQIFNMKVKSVPFVILIKLTKIINISVYLLYAIHICMCVTLVYM